MLTDAPTCVGPLLWYRSGAPGEDSLVVHALVECSACGWWTISNGSADDRHQDTPVVVVE